MIELLANSLTELQHVYTPLPFKMHFIFCIIATLLYLVQFYRKGAKHCLLLLIAVDLTFITQFWTSTVVISALGLAELALLISAGIMSFRYSRAQKKLHESEIKQEQEDAEKASEIEKKHSKNDKKIVDNAFDDEE